MDPITTAIIAALTAAASANAPKAAEQVITDAYEGLKTMLKHKFGIDSKIVKAIGELEENPTSDARKAVLKEEITNAKADQDLDILHTAHALLAQIKAQPIGATIMQTITASGDRSVAAGGDITAPTFTGDIEGNTNIRR